ncbi:MAG: hypothetical protein ABEJ65_12955, partial [bacterium]
MKYPRINDGKTVHIVIAGLGAQAKYSVDIFGQYDNMEVKYLLDLEDNDPDEMDDMMYGVPVKRYKNRVKPLLNDETEYHWIIAYSDNRTKQFY